MIPAQGTNKKGESGRASDRKKPHRTAQGRIAIYLFYVKPDHNRQLNRPDLIENLLRSNRQLTFWANPLFFVPR